jgi:hypothetical protein
MVGLLFSPVVRSSGAIQCAQPSPGGGSFWEVVDMAYTVGKLIEELQKCPIDKNVMVDTLLIEDIDIDDVFSGSTGVYLKTKLDAPDLDLGEFYLQRKPDED